jgi:pyruvate/2-oxoglutarate dehydrogenase complex dihydrolipoamide dehydrogenase (E3) component
MLLSNWEKSSPKGKLDFFGTDFSARDCGSVTSLIENGSQVVRDVEEDAREYLRKSSREPDFVNILSGMRIFVDEVGPRLTVYEVANSRIKVTDVILCAGERQSGTMEQVYH